MGELENFRARIDEIDSEVDRLLSERFEIARKIGLLKRTLGKDVVDYARESVVLEKIKDKDVREIYEREVLPRSRGKQVE